MWREPLYGTKGMGALEIKFRLTSAVTSGGDPIRFGERGVTCIVGSNNVGKSRLLRDIDSMLQDQQPTTVTLSRLIVNRPSVSHAGAKAFLERFARKVEQHDVGSDRFVAPGGGQHVTVEEFVRFYNGFGPTAIPVVKDHLVWRSSAGSLPDEAGRSFQNVSLEDLVGNVVVQLFFDPDAEERLGELSRKTFGQPVFLDRVSGVLQFRVGEVGVAVPPINRPTSEYIQAVRSLPLLEDQGDGFRSFVGLVLNVFSGARRVLLVDEPEAFLHPPQARSLGRWLAREAVDRDVQVVVATHDKDFVLGLVDGGSDQTRVVRLTRSGESTGAHTLNPEEISAVWADPVLRYSNILQGLFHRRVVITESDADCRFYSSVLDYECGRRGRQTIADETVFVPSGGKTRVATLAKATARLGVQTFAILDFDVLKDRRELRGILGALGGEWTQELTDLHQVVVDAVNGVGDWGRLKNMGLSGLPAGEATRSASKLLHLLADRRFLILPFGEMEDADRELSEHGSSWVTRMLELGRHQNCEGVATVLEPLMGQ